MFRTVPCNTFAKKFFFQSLSNNFFLPHPLETSLIQCQLLLSISALWETVSDLFLPSNLSHKPHSWSAPPLGCLRKISKKCKSLALCCLVSIIHQGHIDQFIAISQLSNLLFSAHIHHTQICTIPYVTATNHKESPSFKWSFVAAVGCTRTFVVSFPRIRSLPCPSVHAVSTFHVTQF